MSKGGGKTTTVQKADPWIGAQPHLRKLFSGAEGVYDQGPFNYQANQSPFTRQAQNLTVQRALDPNSLTAQSQGLLGDTISGRYLDPNTNPHFQGAVNDALGMAKSQFAGQYGGQAGQNLGNSGYQEALARGLGAVATNAYSNAYGAERQNQLNAMQMAPGLDYANIAPLAGVGAQQEALGQQQFNAPWENLARYQSMISGQPGGTASTETPLHTNPGANALGGALGGHALASALGFAGPWGAIAGGALGLLSDVRAKEDIERIGTHDELGVGVYKYRYIGDPTPQIGVMAQEVEQVKPEAVGEVNGVKFVNWKMI